MKSLCSPLVIPILRALEWALNRKAVYVYDFDGQRHLRLVYRIPETGWGVTIMGMRGILRDDGTIRGPSWWNSWCFIFPK